MHDHGKTAIQTYGTDAARTLSPTDTALPAMLQTEGVDKNSLLEYASGGAVAGFISKHAEQIYGVAFERQIDRVQVFDAGTKSAAGR
eukprot:5652792-Amphidinium_carterae.3